MSWLCHHRSNRHLQRIILQLVASHTIPIQLPLMTHHRLYLCLRIHILWRNPLYWWKSQLHQILWQVIWRCLFQWFPLLQFERIFISTKFRLAIQWPESVTNWVPALRVFLSLLPSRAFNLQFHPLPCSVSSLQDRNTMNENLNAARGW